MEVLSKVGKQAPPSEIMRMDSARKPQLQPEEAKSMVQDLF